MPYKAQNGSILLYIGTIKRPSVLIKRPLALILKLALINSHRGLLKLAACVPAEPVCPGKLISVLGGRKDITSLSLIDMATGHATSSSISFISSRAAVASDERYRGRLRRRGAAERATARCARPRASTRGEPRPGRGARTAARHRQVALNRITLNPMPYKAQNGSILLYIGTIKRPSVLIKRPLALILKLALINSHRGLLKLAACVPAEPVCPGKLISVLGGRKDITSLSLIDMATGHATSSSISFNSSRNLKFVHGPTLDKFFTREIIKIAIRTPNPKIWPRLHYLVFETSI